MKVIHNEETFQDWVIDRFQAGKGHVQDLSAHGGNVPDLSCSMNGVDYWLELKFGAFKLLHAKYDDFYYREVKRGQLEWLHRRKKAGAAYCGILGYALMRGDHSTTPYVTYHDVDTYLDEFWSRMGLCAGSVILSPCAAAAHSLQTGVALADFIATAARGATRNALAL